MAVALEEARAAAEEGEVPVGAVLVYGDEPLARNHNRTRELTDPTAHAEILVLRDAATQLGDWRLVDSTLYVTLEPCAMCVAAMAHARLARVVFGAYDDKSGAAGGALDLVSEKGLHHRIDVNGGLLADECGKLLQTFFESRRA